MSEPAAPITTNLFDQAPCAMALVDMQGLLEWANPALGALLDLDHAGLIGQQTGTLPEPVSQILSGKPAPVAFSARDGERWLQVLAQPLGERSLLVIHDITEQQTLLQENQRLRQQVEDLKLNDDLTGLPNRRAITQALELQISRSRRYLNPLSVVMVHIALDDKQLASVESGTDPLVLGVSRFLRDRLRWVDQIGRWEDNLFLLVLPETELGDAQGLIDKIKQEQSAIALPAPFDTFRPHLSFGVARWQKGDDMRTLLRQVAHDLAG
jgi:diguanylate cyclase (GGDEF)-like protein